MNYYNGRGMYQLRGHIEDDKSHYLKRIRPLFNKIYGVEIKLREMTSTRVFGFQIWNNKIVEFKEKLGLPLGRKLELQIPKEFLNEKELLIACIRGIFDTDGGLYLERKNNKLYPRIYISTISLNLTKQISYLLSSLGLNATYYISNNQKENKLTSYKIEVRGVDNLHNFFKIINPQNPKHKTKYSSFLNSNTIQTVL